MSHPFPLFQCTEEQWDKIFDTNVKSAFLLTKAVAPHILKRPEGKVANRPPQARMWPLG